MLASSPPFSYQEFIKTWFWYLCIQSFHFIQSTDIFINISFHSNQITEKMFNKERQRKKLRKMYLPPDLGDYHLSMILLYFFQPIFFDHIRKNITRSQRPWNGAHAPDSDPTDEGEKAGPELGSCESALASGGRSLLSRTHACLLQWADLASHPGPTMSSQALV